MSTVAGIFPSRTEAERARDALRTAGVAAERINLLMPGDSDRAIQEAVPISDTEQPGMGSAFGGAVGGALGAATGMQLGAAVASLFVPGVGPVLAAGIIGAAVLGVGGAAAGAAAGGAAEGSIEGLPHDELFVYEDALRQGRSVVILDAEDEAQATAARTALTQAGAESIDTARESWWIGLRDAEEEEYRGQGRDFSVDEQNYRQGFEAAQHPATREVEYRKAEARLRDRYSDNYQTDAFRRGYERGQSYHAGLKEKYRR